jgi:hypothetical protein
MSVDLYRTSYDIFSVVQEVNNAGLPKETGERLLPEGVESGKNRRRPW